MSDHAHWIMLVVRPVACIASPAEVDAKGFKLRDADFSNKSNEELAAEYRKLYDAWMRMCAWGDVVNLVDFDHFMLTNRIMAFLEKRRNERGARETTSELFGVLASPREHSPVQQHDADLLKLLEVVQNDDDLATLFQKDERLIIDGLSSLASFSRMLDEHVRKYDWMQYHYDGPEVLGREYFIGLLKSEIKEGVNAAEKLAGIKKREKELAERQEELEEKLGLYANERHWLQVARTFMYLKALRKDVVYRTSRNAEGLLKEIGARLDTTLELVRFLMIDEVEKLLAERRNADEKLLRQRLEYCVVWLEEGKAAVFVGEEARRREAMIAREEKTDVSELKGMPAMAGLVRGAVKIIAHAKDMRKMQEGDILVSPATNPNLVPAMKKAGAIVTDEGGITCHAAIVSRELGIPCVVGTRIATKAFKDGDFVEVDAANGIVRRLQKAP